jgi:ABC-2 type transport system permease protein
MRALHTMLRKELRQLRRDKRMLPIVFIAPVFQLLLLGYAANLDVEHVALLVLDRDRSSASRALVTAFDQTETFQVFSRAERSRAISEGIDRGRVRLALVIPAGFAADLTSGRRPVVQLIVDGANSTVAAVALSRAAEIVRTFGLDQGGRGLAGAGGPGFHLPVTGISGGLEPRAPVEVRERIWYNPQLETRRFMVPGILALLLMVMTTLLTSLAVVKEKENGTLEQLNVSPLSPRQLIAGKLVPFVLIGIVDVVLVLAVTPLLFGLFPKGSIPLLFMLTLLFLLTTLGLGLLVSTVSRTQQQAMMVSVFFVMIPMFFLSGFAFPIESMPALIRYLSYLLPLRYYFVIIRGIFLKASGLAELWDEALALLLFGLGILALSVARFRKRMR